MGWLFNPVEALAVLVYYLLSRCCPYLLHRLQCALLKDIIIYGLCFGLCKNYIMSMVCVPVSAKNSEKEGILDEK